MNSIVAIELFRGDPIICSIIQGKGNNIPAKITAKPLQRNRFEEDIEISSLNIKKSILIQQRLPRMDAASLFRGVLYQ